MSCTADDHDTTDIWWLLVTPLVDRLAEIARWCLVAVAFALTVPVSAVGGFYAVALAVSR